MKFTQDDKICPHCGGKLSPNTEYSAQRSTGATGEPPYGVYPIKPQEDIREKIVFLIECNQFWTGNDILTEVLADKILEIVRGA